MAAIIDATSGTPIVLDLGPNVLDAARAATLAISGALGEVAGALSAEAANAAAIAALPVSLAIHTGTTGASLVGADDGASGSFFTTAQGFITKLLSSAGSSLAGFIQSGSGAVATTVQSKLRESVSLKDFGSVENGTTDDSSAVTNAASNAKRVLVQGTSLGSNVAIANVIDTRFYGQGALKTVYRKNVIPDESPAAEFWKADLCPDRHLKQFNTNPKPSVTLMGDSISTYMANSWVRGDMLTDVLYHELLNQKPNGLTFRNRAIGGTTFASAMGVQYQTYIPWYAGNSNTAWITLVGNEKPDLVILSWQMNYDAPGGVKNDFCVADLDAVINWIGGTFNPIPSIVVCTGFVPSPASAAFPQGQAGQETRDGAAGAIRQYVKWKRLPNGQEIGLLDFHRMFCRSRDGFDPVSSCISKIGTTAINSVTAGSTKVATGDTLCHDWKIQVAANLNTMIVGDYLIFFHGYGADDFFLITKTSTTQASFTAYSGTLASNIPLYSQTFAFDMTQTGPFTMSVEKSGNIVTIYTDQDSQYGTFTAPSFVGKIVGLGGDYYPRVESHGSSSGTWFTGGNFYYGVPRVNTPSIKDSLFFGREALGAISPNGGSGYNHPSGFAATHVYRPMIQAVDWHRNVGQSGSLSISSGVSAATITFPYAEPDTAYTVEIAFEGSSPGQTWACGTKNLGSAIINFVNVTTFATVAKWRLSR